MYLAQPTKSVYDLEQLKLFFSKTAIFKFLVSQLGYDYPDAPQQTHVNEQPCFTEVICQAYVRGEGIHCVICT